MSCQVGTSTLDTHTSPTQICLLYACPRRRPSSGRESRPHASTGNSSDSESSPATRASHPRSAHYWLHSYRGVRYYFQTTRNTPHHHSTTVVDYLFPSSSSVSIVRSSSNGPRAIQSPGTESCCFFLFDRPPSAECHVMHLRRHHITLVI
jgi:hypothetical protein